MQYKRKMGIDFGEARIGIAFSDLLCMLATGRLTLTKTTDEEDIKTLIKLAKENDVDEIVFGLPLNMDGTEGERAKRTKDFGLALEKASKIKVSFEDERLSSYEAEEILKQRKVKWQDRKKVLDQISAEIILQTYLNSHK